MRGLVILAIVLLVVWVLGWTVLKITSGLIHLLLIVALVLFVMGLLRRGGKTV